GVTRGRWWGGRRGWSFGFRGIRKVPFTTTTRDSRASLSSPRVYPAAMPVALIRFTGPSLDRHVAALDPVHLRLTHPVGDAWADHGFPGPGSAGSRHQ